MGREKEWREGERKGRGEGR